MLASRRRGVIYVGVTSDLEQRLLQHKAKALGGFTAKYDVDKLVWFEMFDRMDDAIACEKRIKRYRRDRKIDLIEASNPDWSDLSQT